MAALMRSHQVMLLFSSGIKVDGDALFRFIHPPTHRCSTPVLAIESSKPSPLSICLWMRRLINLVSNPSCYLQALYYPPTLPKAMHGTERSLSTLHLRLPTTILVHNTRGGNLHHLPMCLPPKMVLPPSLQSKLNLNLSTYLQPWNPLTGLPS